MKKEHFYSRGATTKLLLLLLVCLCTRTTAQITDARVVFTPAATGFNSGSFQLSLPDSTGFSDIEIQVIELVDDTTIFSGVFAFDQTAGLPFGWSWARQGTRISMGMGTLPEGNAWRGKARVKPNGEPWSEWLVFLFN